VVSEVPIKKKTVDHMTPKGAISRKPATPDLAALRQAKNLSLAQISEATKIREHYLRAIEESRFEDLPGGVFATSYIRQYARAIDYDECDLLAAYSATLPEEEPEESPAAPRGLIGILLRSLGLRQLAPR